MRKIVLDTNVVLDLFVFRDERVSELHAALKSRELHWIATAAMREEFACVLDYPNLSARAGAIGKDGALSLFDGAAVLVDAPARCAIACRDDDDKKFIDLAVAHGAMLLSKDAHVLALRKKLAAAGVAAAPQFNAPTQPKTGPAVPSASTS